MDSTVGSFGARVERLFVELARLVVLAELVEDGRLGREQPPVGLVRRLRPADDVERLLELAAGGERLAVGGADVAVVGEVDRRLLQDGDRLVGLARRGEAPPRS